MATRCFRYGEFQSFGVPRDPHSLQDSRTPSSESKREKTLSLGRTQSPQCRFAQWAEHPPRMGTDSGQTPFFSSPPLIQSSREASRGTSALRRDSALTTPARGRAHGWEMRSLSPCLHGQDDRICRIEVQSLSPPPHRRLLPSRPPPRSGLLAPFRGEGKVVSKNVCIFMI